MDPVLQVRDVVKRYPIRHGSGELTALAGVSFDLAAGQTLGILGESGCGKSTLAKVLVQLEPATSGTVRLDGTDLGTLRGRALRARRREIQMVFQDPFSSLNPRHRIGEILGAVLDLGAPGTGPGARPKGRRARDARVAELLDLVGLDARFAARLPHEMSGGQRQRVGIARALALGPRVIVLDEPVSALDVSVRAEIMNLLIRLQRELDLAYVFISHDMSMIRHIADRVAVMYLGRVVETGPWREVVDDPAHPYTRALRLAVPVPDPTLDQPMTATITGEVPNPADPPTGCTFHPRCPLAVDLCREVEPPLEPDPHLASRLISCHVVAGRVAGRGQDAGIDHG